MTAERLLVALSVVAVGLLTTAIMVTGGKTPSLAGASLGLSSLSELPSQGTGTMLGVGVVAGWLLRWTYSLPWGAIPRTVIGWLLGWRSSVVLLGVAFGCMAILVLY